MANLLRDCPFPVDKNLSFDLKSDCLLEVSPYKNLNDITRFLHLISSGKIFPWLENVNELRPATDFCYGYDNSDNGEGWYPKPRLNRNSVPKTLFCHDYKGGYLEDRFINGTSKHDAYNFFNWACVDIFVYFSHHFITVPPPSWINAAHTNGVPILGTLITEWDDGKIIWDQILEAEEKLFWFADILSLIAAIHKFDGYLLNIENTLDKHKIVRLIKFIQLLKQKLKNRKRTRTYVIWYDSVTVDGVLKWQNELNELNKPFFDVTDGIFLNYTWNELNLEMSKISAGERLHDVFVGVDVFGRNQYGGGGFNTDLAMKKVRENNLSAAIFAFAWTEEGIPGQFHINDKIFWSKLMPYFYIHGTKQLPFKTDFNRGYGLKFYQAGNVTSKNPWSDLSKQNIQINFKAIDMENDEVSKGIVSTINDLKALLPEDDNFKRFDLNRRLNLLYDQFENSTVEFVTDYGFNGGGCLKINPSYQRKGEHISLFVCDLRVKTDWIVHVTSKLADIKDQLFKPNDYPYLYVIIETEDKILVKKELKDSISAEYYGKSSSSSTVPGMVPEIRDHFWVTRKYLMYERGNIIEIGIYVQPSVQKTLLLGEISISEW